MTITLPFGWHLTDTAKQSNLSQFFSIWEITLWLRMIRWCDPSAVSWGGPAAPWLPQCELLRLDGAGGWRLGLRSQVPHLCDEQKSATSFLTWQADEVLQSQSLHVRSFTNLPLTMLPQVKWYHSFRVSGIQLEGLSQAIMKVQLGQASPLWSSREGSSWGMHLLCGPAHNAYWQDSVSVVCQPRFVWVLDKLRLPSVFDWRAQFIATYEME